MNSKGTETTFASYDDTWSKWSCHSHDLMSLLLPLGEIARNAWRGLNNYWATGAPWWKREEKHLSLATQRLRGPEAPLVRFPSYISRCCCVMEAQRLKSLWFPREWSSGVTWRARSRTQKQKVLAPRLGEGGVIKLIKSQEYGPLSIEQQDRSRVFTH